MKKGKTCPYCHQMCGNATKKCKKGSHNFECDLPEEETEDRMDTESSSGSESSSTEINSESKLYEDSSEGNLTSEESEESDKWKKKNNFSETWSNFEYLTGFTKKQIWGSPFKSFSEIWDSMIMKQLVNQTNIYGKQKYKKHWENITEQIMKWCLSIFLTISLAPYRGDLRDLWSSNPIVKHSFIAERFSSRSF